METLGFEGTISLISNHWSEIIVLAGALGGAIVSGIISVVVMLINNHNAQKIEIHKLVYQREHVRFETLFDLLGKVESMHAYLGETDAEKWKEYLDLWGFYVQARPLLNEVFRVECDEIVAYHESRKKVDFDDFDAKFPVALKKAMSDQIECLIGYRNYK